ncbi:MAG: DNA-binding response regulator [Anaerolineaceae bacterium]|nr:DNA-binding response regulator [Anaerolineaceae bacterium]
MEVEKDNPGYNLLLVSSIKAGIIKGMRSEDKIRILLADDHAVVRAGIRQFLEQSADIKVIAEASNGQEAREFLEKNIVDVAVLDIQMPLMSGIELTRWVRSSNLSIGILILTAYEEEPYVRAVLQAGANGYVLKSADPDEIIEAVQDVFQGKSVLDPNLTQKLFIQLATPDDPPISEALTNRELQVLAHTAKGYTNKAIGMQLGISDRTVQNHLANIFQKMNAESRTEAVMKAVSQGLISTSLDEPAL